MKRLKYMLSLFLVGVLTLSFASCGGDGDVEESIETSICGKWVCVSADYNGFSNEDGIKVGDILYINENNTYRITGGEVENGTWKKEGNKLICKLDSFSWTYTIIKLTNKELIMAADLFGITLSFKR